MNRMNSRTSTSVLALCVTFVTAALLAFAFFLPTASRAADEADPKVLELGKQRFAENCSGFCHGAGGKGARAPCLICGKFKRGGTDEEIIKNTTEGIANTPMGAFGDKLAKEDIAAIVVFLRDQQKKKEAEPQ